MKEMTVLAVAVLLILATVWLELITDNVYMSHRRNLWRRLTRRGRKEEKRAVVDASPYKTEKKELDKLTARAEMQNFYLYDGSPQRDPREIARDQYEGKAK